MSIRIRLLAAMLVLSIMLVGGFACVEHILHRHQLAIDRDSFLLLEVFCGLAAGVALSLLFSRLLSRPFDLLAREAERLAGGDLDRVVRSSPIPEFARLANSLNAMRTSLRERIEELRSKNEALEAEVGERKRVELEVRRSEAFLSNIIDSVDDPIFVKDEEHRWVLLNQAWYRTMGYSPGNTLGKSDFDFYPEEEARVFWEKDEQVLRSGEANVNIEEITVGGDVRKVITQKAPFTDESGRKFITGIMRDITERMRAEEALRASESRFRTLAENLPGVVYLCDNDDRFSMHYLNDAVEEITGYPRSDFMSDKRSFVDLYHPDDEAYIFREVAEAVEEKRSFYLVYRLRRCDGEWRWIEEFGTGIYENDNVRLLEGFFRDITARRQAEEEHRRLEAQVQHSQKLESLGVLAGGIAHDFNNILMAILGNADLALARLEPDAAACRNIEDIVKASRRAADLCNQMLAYSGKGRFMVQPIDLCELVREMASILEVSISKRAVIEYAFAGELPAVDADATQLRQVVMNLITNASEAIGEQDGIITVAAGSADCDGALLHKAYLAEDLTPGHYVFLEVADTGCGMDKGTIERVFEPFFSTKFTGRGLGMAAVLGIVRGHKGFIAIQSEPDVGTTFRIYFPASGQPAVSLAPVTELDPPGAGWAGGGLVLLVDDEETVRDVGAQMLEALDFETVVACDGFEALEIFLENAERIACVILDLTMPRMDGKECLRELRQIRSEVRVILTSGFTEEEIAARFAGEGLAGFLQKPFQVASLRNVLHSVLAVEP